MRKILLLCAAALWSLTGAAQTAPVTGSVYSEAGAPVVGATVLVDGTSVGTITAGDGSFSVSAKPDAVLVVSFIGFESLEVPVGGRTHVEIVLHESSHAIDDVVVVGYGTTTKTAFTGSVAVVKDDDLAKRQVSNVTKALSGVTAGVQITSANGQPGTSASVRIRGVGSMSASNTPLYVVDGVPYDGQISAINTADIESMSVLKDAAASSIYGARGANGVVLITTKRGKSRDAVVTFDAKWGSNSRAIPQYDVITDPGQYMELAYQSVMNSDRLNYGMSIEAALADAESIMYKSSEGGVGYRVFTYPEGETLVGLDGKLNPNAQLGYVLEDRNRLVMPDNWYDELFNKGNLRQEYNVSISGTTDRINYYASLGYLDDTGLMTNSGFSRYSVRLKADYQAKKWLKFGGNFSYANMLNKTPSEQTTWGGSTNLFYITGMMAPIYPLYARSADGTILKDSYGYTVYDFGDSTNGLPYNRVFMSGSNPASLWELDKREYNYDDLSSRLYAQVDIVKGLKFTYNIGLDVSNQSYRRLYNPFYGQYSQMGGIIYRGHYRNFAINQQQLLEYNHSFCNKHNLGILVGHESYKLKMGALEGSREKVFNPDVVELDNAISQQASYSSTDHYATEGYLGQVKYDYDGKYFVSGSFRRDASSRFAKSHRWGNFWSVGAGWVLSREHFLEGKEWIDLLKIKASYGVQGNDDLLYQGSAYSNYYPYQDQYTLSENNGEFAMALTYKGNPDITWESNHSANAGVEFSFWNRLSGSVEWFTRTTTDMLYFLPTPASGGYSYYPMNAGSVRNSGLEIDLNGVAIDKKHVKWSLYANMTYLKNKILSLEESLGNEWIDGSYIYQVGESMYQRYLRNFAGLTDEGQALWYKDVRDKDGNVIQSKGAVTTEYADADRYATGDTMPKVYGGFGTTFECYGIDLSIGFAYQLGGRIYDYTYADLMHSGTSSTMGSNWHKDILKAWKIGDAADSTDVPRLNFEEAYGANSTSDRFMISSNYLDITNITLGYTLPKSWTSKLHIDKLRIYMAVDNVWVFSKRQGLDPRQSYTVSGSYNYAPIRTISGGINLSF